MFWLGQSLLRHCKTDIIKQDPMAYSSVPFWQLQLRHWQIDARVTSDITTWHMFLIALIKTQTVWCENKFKCHALEYISDSWQFDVRIILMLHPNIHFWQLWLRHWQFNAIVSSWMVYEIWCHTLEHFFRTDWQFDDFSIKIALEYQSYIPIKGITLCK